MEISRVQRFSVPVGDQDRAKDFYVEALGFELVRELPVPMGEDARWIEGTPEGREPGLVLVNWFDGVERGSVQGLMLETRDLDEDCGRLRADGVAVEGPFETPWGRQATLEDPDGNGLVLVEPTTEAS